MRADAFLRLDGVWKRFRRGEIHDSLRDLLPALTKRLVRPAPDVLRKNEFWALRDVSFEVLPGQALGIIGGNGAGKSTTLKILTRILRPTRGSTTVNGRIGALIEVSAGFHQDLTGRENVFLQGSIMGMPTTLIRQRFDEIVEFSEIGEFLDTPVKRYSSGMQARLGFSIAAHLDPDVLIIDEVLAVGDFRFQDRAFGRISDLVKSGIPVVIVSHQLDRIAALCTEAIVLDHGAVAHRGTTADCIAWYLSGSRAALADTAARSGIRLDRTQAIGKLAVTSGSPIEVELAGEVVSERGKGEQILIRVRSAATGQIEFGTGTERCGIVLPSEGPFRLWVRLELNLRPGVYTIEPSVHDQMHGWDIAAGPIAYAEVVNDPGFIGTTQLKPQMRLLP